MVDRLAEDLAGAARGEVVAEAVAVAVGDLVVAAEDRLGDRLGVHLGAPEARAVRAAQGVQAAQVLPALEAPVRRPADHLAQVCPSFQHLSQSTSEKTADSNYKVHQAAGEAPRTEAVPGPMAQQVPVRLESRQLFGRLLLGLQRSGSWSFFRGGTREMS